MCINFVFLLRNSTPREKSLLKKQSLMALLSTWRPSFFEIHTDKQKTQKHLSAFSWKIKMMATQLSWREHLAQLHQSLLVHLRVKHITAQPQRLLSPTPTEVPPSLLLPRLGLELGDTNQLLGMTKWDATTNRGNQGWLNRVWLAKIGNWFCMAWISLRAR